MVLEEKQLWSALTFHSHPMRGMSHSWCPAMKRQMEKLVRNFCREEKRVGWDTILQTCEMQQLAAMHLPTFLTTLPHNTSTKLKTASYQLQRLITAYEFSSLTDRLVML